ncbi:WXG100 family type VII secretion target [Nocardia alni]|uniref:WXG100 family type VII secretion target n=1 Tax=Nocardia alni TaxID=2815723 RepID=UPI001C24134B|nr:WXG100 family type VII secretion target [Nocardia alni]
MSMPIYVGYTQVQDAASTVSKIVGSMSQDSQSLAKLSQTLLEAFRGAGATGYESVMTQLNTKATAYQNSLTSLNSAATNAVLHLQSTDVQAGNRFNSL